LSALVGPSALRRALSIVPVAIIGYGIAWFLYVDPSQKVTAKPAAEIKPEVTQVAAPVVPPPPAQPDVAEAKPAPTAAPVAQAVTVVAVEPSRPLSRDEIKELQGKLGAIGFTAGPVDGVVGPQTQAALRRYAESRRLAKPEATQETLLRLRSETQASQ
jgi:peptidoglycan hydrolase-like protein with peptidoglycan-binding domain